MNQKRKAERRNTRNRRAERKFKNQRIYYSK